MKESRRMKTRLFPRILPLAALSAVALGGVGSEGCNRGGGNEGGGAPTGAGKASPAAQQSQGTQVSVTPARLDSTSDVIQVTGSLNSLNDVTVGVKTSGKMIAVYVREGDRIRSGQVVAQQDTTDLQSQLDQQRANLQTAQTKVSQAQVAYTNAVTTLEWTDAQTRSAVRQAQAALTSAREQAKIVESGARPQERAQAEEAVVAAKAELDSAGVDRGKAHSDLRRYQLLARDGAISAQQLDQAQSVADSADAHYNSLKARYNSAVQARSLLQEGSRQEDIRRAQAAVEEATQALATAQSNRDQVAMRRADVENARVAIKTAEAGVRQAQAAVRLAEQALRDSAIRSPIDGVVAERKVEPGMQVATVKPDVMRIVALNTIYFDAQLSETQYSETHVGLPVRVMVDALNGRTFQGTVSKIFPVASPTARSFTARIGIRNEGNALRPQMFARGQITLVTHPHAIVIPRDALLDLNGNSARVFLAKNGVAHSRPVKIGITTFAVVEVTSGLHTGDPVITSGQAQLQDGDKIQVQNP
jgi:HlyD family secretion protein